MSKGNNTLKCTVSFSSADLLPANLNMSKTMTLTVPGTAAGNAAQLLELTVPQASAGSGVFIPPNTEPNDITGRAYYFVQNTGTTYNLIVRLLDDHSTGGTVPDQLGDLAPGEFALYNLDDGVMDSDGTRDHLRLELSCATAVQTTTATVMFWEMDA